MMKSIAVLLAFAVAAQAYEIASQHQNTYRTFGNLGQISTYGKAIDTPFSSVRKSDVRISNPGISVAAPYAHAAYAAPLAHAAYAAPIAHAAYPAAYPAAYAHGPVVAKAVAPAGGLLGVAYSAAPAVAHMTYSNGLGISYAW